MRKKVVVVGGGVAGLAAAYRLTRGNKYDVSLLEAGPRLGGKIVTERAGDLVFESGPDSFITPKPWAMELVRELGMEGDILCTSESKKDVFIYTRGKMRRFPDGMMMMAPKKVLPVLMSDFAPLLAKIRMGMDYLLPRGDPGIDESIGSFVRRRFGTEAVELIGGPVLASIHAGDPNRLSLKSAFPQFVEMERKYRSILIAMKKVKRPPPEPGGPKLTMFVTLKGGLDRLVKAVTERLPGGTVRLSTELKEIKHGGSAAFRLKLVSGETIPADCVVLACPANKAAQVLGEINESLAAELQNIEFSSTAVINLAYPDKALAQRLGGFGFVVDRREDTVVTAGTYSSCKFPGRIPEGTAAIRCFLGGVGKEKSMDMSDEDLSAAVRRDLKRMLGIEAEPSVVKLRRWPNANPQYNTGHQARVERIDDILKSHPGLFLAGGSYVGVGVPDCIRSGSEAAKALLAANDAKDSPSGVV